MIVDVGKVADCCGDTQAPLAEFADLMAATNGRTPHVRLPSVLRDADLSSPIVDLGAGTGLGAVAVAEQLPGARVYAVERAPAMRAVLLSRVAFRPDVRERVTVVPADFLTAELPPRWAAAIAVHVVCQLSPVGRTALWRLLGRHLADGAVVVMDRHYGPARAERTELKLSSSVRVGDHMYQRWYAAEPASPESVLVRNTYRVLRGDATVYERVVETVRWTVSESEVVSEAETVGLRHVPLDDDLVLFRRT